MIQFLRRGGFHAAILTTFSLLFSACGGGQKEAPNGPLVLKGSGATAPYLAYAKWIETFHKQESGLKIEYRPNGSGQGIRDVESGAVDFAASDIPISDEELAKQKIKMLHYPMLIGAVVPVYNVTGVAGEVKFTPATLAGIFSGKIKNWGDAALARDNAGLNLPAAPIVVIHRSDASGTTHALADFLSRSNETWKKEMGDSPSLVFKVGQGAASNEQVAELVKKTAHSIGYVELNYAEQAKLSFGSVKNAAGKFVKPTLQGMGKAVDSAKDLDKEYRASIANAPGDEAYPICTLSWLIVPKESPDPEKQKAMKRFLRWAYADGQRIAMSMDYGTLPQPVLDSAKQQIEMMRSMP